jgi:hypothetical protein
VLRIYSEWLRDKLGVILLGAFFAVMFGMFLNRLANDASPIQSVDPIDATIKSAQWAKGHTIYVLFLENGSPVLIDDDRPHLIGSRMGIERVTRDNGFVFFRFPE